MALRQVHTSSDEENQPIDINNVYRWRLRGFVKICGMFIDEDGNCQVRVIDRGDRRLIDAETVYNLVDGGGITLIGKADEYPHEPWQDPYEE